MIQSSRPRELVYFFYIPIPTADKGGVYFFMAMDDFSQFAFVLGTEEVISTDIILQKIKTLLKHNDFKQVKQEPFKLVIQSEFKEIERELFDIIHSKNGSVIFNDKLLEKNTQTLVADLYDHFGIKSS